MEVPVPTDLIDMADFIPAVLSYIYKSVPALLAHKDCLNAVVNTCVVLVVFLLCMCCRGPFGWLMLIGLVSCC